LGVQAILQSNGIRQNPNRGKVWVTHSDLRIVRQKVPAGYTLVAVVPGTDCAAEAKYIEPPNGAKRRAPRTAAEEARALARRDGS